MDSREDIVNEYDEVAEFMKNATVEEILKNEKLWGEDLSFLKDVVENATL